MLDEFRLYLRDGDRSERTVAGYLHDLSLFAIWFQQSNGEPLSPRSLTPSDVREYRQYMLLQHFKPATINRHLAAIRAYGEWCRDSGQAASNPVNGVRGVDQVALAPKWLDKKSRAALERELEKRVQNARTDTARFLSQRNQAVIVLLLNTGLRVSELAALEMDDVNITERKGDLNVRYGKGGKAREVPLNATARAILKAWLAIRPAVSSNLFTTADGPLSARSVQILLQDLGKAIGVEVTPHALRHTFAKTLVDGGISLDRVAALLGHTNLNTTKVYTTPGRDDLRKTVEILD